MCLAEINNKKTKSRQSSFQACGWNLLARRLKCVWQKGRKCGNSRKSSFHACVWNLLARCFKCVWRKSTKKLKKFKEIKLSGLLTKSSCSLPSPSQMCFPWPVQQLTCKGFFVMLLTNLCSFSCICKFASAWKSTTSGPNKLVSLPSSAAFLLIWRICAMTYRLML